MASMELPQQGERRDAWPGAGAPLQWPGNTQDQAAMTARDAAASGNDPEGESTFRMFYMKVSPCTKKYVHEWTECPFAHPSEKAHRRPPTCHTGIACPEMKRDGWCPRQEACPYAHNVFEYWLHPTRYRTQMCNDLGNCKRHLCFFAHNHQQLRVPAVKPFVSPEMLARGVTNINTAAILHAQAIGAAGSNAPADAAFHPAAASTLVPPKQANLEMAGQLNTLGMGLNAVPPPQNEHLVTALALLLRDSYSRTGQVPGMLAAQQGLLRVNPEAALAANEAGVDMNLLQSQLLLQAQMQANTAAQQQVAEGNVWTDEYGNMHPAAKFGLSPYSSVSLDTPRRPLDSFAGMENVLSSASLNDGGSGRRSVSGSAFWTPPNDGTQGGGGEELHAQALALAASQGIGSADSILRASLRGGEGGLSLDPGHRNLSDSFPHTSLDSIREGQVSSVDGGGLQPMDLHSASRVSFESAGTFARRSSDGFPDTPGVRADLLDVSGPFTRASYDGGERRFSSGSGDEGKNGAERGGPQAASAFSHASLMAMQELFGSSAPLPGKRNRGGCASWSGVVRGDQQSRSSEESMRSGYSRDDHVASGGASPWGASVGTTAPKSPFGGPGQTQMS